MPLRPGDVVGLSVSPKIKLGKYDGLRPFASLTRTMGEDPQADLADMESVLTGLFFQSLHLEVELLSQSYDLLEGATTVEAAVETIKRKLGPLGKQIVRTVQKAPSAVTRSNAGAGSSKVRPNVVVHKTAR